MGLQFSITAIGSIMLQSANNGLGHGLCRCLYFRARIKMFFICAFESLGIAMVRIVDRIMEPAGRTEFVKVFPPV